MRTRVRRPRRRAAVIRELDLLDAPPRGDLVAVADLAAQVCGVPMAAINLLTDHEQHCLAPGGSWPHAACAIDDSMCAHMLDPRAVPGGRAGLLGATRASPTTPSSTARLDAIRFYASQRLVTPGTRPRHPVRLRPGRATSTTPRSLPRHAGRPGRRRPRALGAQPRPGAAAGRGRGGAPQLERSNERLGSFAGQVSHDLRTPLTTVSLALGVVHEQLVREQR